MKHFHVWWHIAAEEELASLWIESRFRSRLSEAVSTIEHALQVEPQSKGTPHALARLDDSEINLLMSRINQLPEDLQSLSEGPISVLYFVIDSEKLVVIVRLRKSSDGL